MSALPSSSFVPQPAPAGAEWIDLATASSRSGRSVGHLARQCRDEWAARGLAEQRRPDGGGKPTWMIRDDADASLSRVKSPQHLPFDMTTLTAAQRDELLLREQILRDLDSALASAVSLGIPRRKIVEQFSLQLQIDRSIKASPATLYNWQRDYRASGRAGLIDARWKQPAKADRDTIYDAFKEHQQRMFLTKRQLSKTLSYELTAMKAQEMGWEIPDAKKARRWLEAIDDGTRIKLREGNDAYTDKVEPAVRRDYSTLDSNTLWCGDHHRFDVMVIDPQSPSSDPKFVRPWLTAWQDVRSRKIVGWSIFVTDPNTDTIIRAFKMGVKSHGKPGGVYIDNGKDYDSRALQGISKRERRGGKVGGGIDQARLGGIFGWCNVAVTHAWKFHGQSKPIERFFGTVCSRFSKLFDTYCGKDTQSKPEDLADKLKAGHAPTLDEFVQNFEQWLQNDYHARAHGGDSMDGQAPADVFEQCLIEKVVIEETMLDFYCLPFICPVKKKRDGTIVRGLLAGQQGIVWQGLYYGTWQADVQALWGKRVGIKIDENNCNRVFVCDLKERLITVAKLTEDPGFISTKEQVAAAVGQKKKIRKLKSDYIANRPRMALDTLGHLSRVPADRKKRQSDAPLKPHRTELDDQLIEIQKAMHQEQGLRIAVGAESMSDDAPQSISLAQLMASRMNQTGGDDND